MLVTFKYNCEKYKRRSASTSTSSTPITTGRTTRRSSMNTNNNSNNSHSTSLTSNINDGGLTDHNLRSNSTNSTPSKMVTLQYNNTLLTPTSRRTTRRQSQILNSANSNNIGSPQISLNSSPIKKGNTNKSLTPTPSSPISIPLTRTTPTTKTTTTTSMILNSRIKNKLENIKNYQDKFNLISNNSQLKDSNIIQFNHDLEKSWFNDIHIITDQLNFIKETYKAIQYLKKKKQSLQQQDGEESNRSTPGLLSSPNKDTLMIEDEDEGEILDEEDDHDDDDDEEEENIDENQSLIESRRNNKKKSNNTSTTTSNETANSSGNESSIVQNQTFIPLGKRTRRKVQFQ